MKNWEVLLKRNNREDIDRFLPLVEAFRRFVFPKEENLSKVLLEAKNDSCENEEHIGSHYLGKL